MRFKKLDHALQEIERLEQEAKYGKVAYETVIPLLTELGNHLEELGRRYEASAEENTKLQNDLESLTRTYQALEASYRFELEKRRFYQGHPLVKVMKPLLGSYQSSPPPVRGPVPRNETFFESRIGREGLKGNLDLPSNRFERLRQEDCIFSGWFLDSQNRPAKRVTLVQTGHRHDCILFQYRGDLRNLYPDLPSGSENAGFQGRLKLPVGLNTVEVEVEFEGIEPFVAYERDLLYVPGVDDHFSHQQAVYKDWIEHFDQLSERQVKEFSEKLSTWEQRPLVSVVIPVYNPILNFLEEAVDSVLQQVYPDWELILVHDASPHEEVRPALERLGALDGRIRVVERAENGGISRATQTGVEAATGEFIAFFDQDDLLRPHSLYSVVYYLQDHPDCGLIYTDEDKVDGEGERFEPYFKPDWNPELLTSQNYISHLSVVRKSVLDRAGALDPELDGAQDWDLMLRVTRALKPGQIGHIHRVLYHWRALEGSTAWHEGEKDTRAISVQVLEKHLKRCEEPGEVRVVDDRYYIINYDVPDPAPGVDLLIPTRDRLEDLKTCVDSILEKTDYPNFRITILNNQSQNPNTYEYFDQLKARGVQILDYDQAFNYSAINNFGVEQTAHPILGLINNDLEIVDPLWLRVMVGQVVRPQTGVVGCKLLYGNNTIQHAGVVLGIGGVAGHAFKYFPKDYSGQMMRPQLTQNYSAVTAACCLVRREVFQAIGGLDAKNLTVAFNDIDFCLKVREAGYRNVYVPVEVYHHESRSRGPENTTEKQERFRREVKFMETRWGELLSQDPAYNLNLTLDTEDFSFAPAPRPNSDKYWYV